MKTCLEQPILIKIFNAKNSEQKEGGGFMAASFPADKMLTRGGTVQDSKGKIGLKSRMTPNMRHIKVQKSGTSTSACPHQYAEG